MKVALPPNSWIRNRFAVPLVFTISFVVGLLVLSLTRPTLAIPTGAEILTAKRERQSRQAVIDAAAAKQIAIESQWSLLLDKAEAGIADAQLLVGGCYLVGDKREVSGHGLIMPEPMDWAKARYWLTLAKRNNASEASKLLETLNALEENRKSDDAQRFVEEQALNDHQRGLRWYRITMENALKKDGSSDPRYDYKKMLEDAGRMSEEDAFKKIGIGHAQIEEQLEELRRP